MKNNTLPNKCLAGRLRITGVKLVATFRTTCVGCENEEQVDDILSVLIAEIAQQLKAVCGNDWKSVSRIRVLVLIPEHSP